MKHFLLSCLLAISIAITYAQDEHSMPMHYSSMHSGMQDTMPMKGGMKHNMPMDSMSMGNMNMGGMEDMQMSHAYSRNLPMNRDGSGTSWLPDASPVYGIMLPAKKWMFMVHGNIFLRYTKQDFSNKGSRGDEAFDAPNWLMLMAQRKVGKNGLFHFSVMASLDAVTEGGGGYPLLFQTGESWKGQPLKDHQHPHDLVSELSIGYSQALSKKVDVFGYFGYPGEPSIGSVAFMHRVSAMAIPDAPISHHWNDGTHITFGVATIGVRLDKFKLEASSFTGREPNENRYNFDKATFDSWSGRISFNPSKNWALQVSHAYVKSPEKLHPEENVDRTTASVIASYPLGNETYFDATALWGLNKIKGQDGDNAALAEATLRIKRAAFYTRYEWVQKTGEELDLDSVQYKSDAIFPVNEIVAGASYDLLHVQPVNIAIGGQLSLYHASSQLDALYGKNPMGGEIYLRIYPAVMKMKHSMQDMSGM